MKFVLAIFLILPTVYFNSAFAQASGAIHCKGQSENFFSESARIMLTANARSQVLLTNIELSMSSTNGNQPIRAASAIGDTRRHPTTTVFSSAELVSSAGSDNCHFTIELSKTASPLRGKLNAWCDQTYSAIYFRCE